MVNRKADSDRYCSVTLLNLLLHPVNIPLISACGKLDHKTKFDSVTHRLINFRPRSYHNCSMRLMKTYEPCLQARSMPDNSGQISCQNCESCCKSLSKGKGDSRGFVEYQSWFYSVQAVHFYFLLQFFPFFPPEILLLSLCYIIQSGTLRADIITHS